MGRRTAFEKHKSERKPCSRIKRWAGAALLATSLIAKPVAANAEDTKVDFSYENNETNIEAIRFLSNEFEALGKKKFKEVYKEEINEMGSYFTPTVNALTSGKVEVSDAFVFEIVLPKLKSWYNLHLHHGEYEKNIYDALTDEESEYYSVTHKKFLQYLGERAHIGIDGERKANAGYALLYFSKEDLMKLHKELGIEYFARYPPEILESCLDVLENKGPEEGKKLVLVTGGKGDWNGAFYNYRDLMQFYDRNYDFLIVEISDSKELYEKWEWFADNMDTPADAVVVRAHGNPDSIYLKNSESFSIDVLDVFLILFDSYMDLFQKPHQMVSVYEKRRKILKGGGLMVFQSCSTGEKMSGIASKISELIEAKSFAPAKPTYLGVVYFDEDGNVKNVEYENESGLVETRIFEASTEEAGLSLINDMVLEFPVFASASFDYMRHNIGRIFSGSTRVHTSIVDENMHFIGNTKDGVNYFFYHDMFSLRFEIKKFILGVYFSGNTVSEASPFVGLDGLPWSGKIFSLFGSPMGMLMFMGPKGKEETINRTSDLSVGGFIGGGTDWNKGLGQLRVYLGGGYSSAGEFSLVESIYLRHYKLDEDGYTPLGRLEFVQDAYVSGVHKGINAINLSSHLSYRHKNVGGILSAYGGKISDSMYLSGDLEIFWMFLSPGFISTSVGGSWTRMNESWLEAEYGDWYATVNAGAMFSIAKMGLGIGIGSTGGNPQLVLRANIAPLLMEYLGEVTYHAIKK